MANTFGKASPERNKSNTINQHRQSIPAIINNLIYQADIILEVLDARFIERTRHPVIEKKIRSMHKRIIYVLNKADLVNTHEIDETLELAKLNPHVFFSSKEKKGVVVLRNLIKKEAKKVDKDAVNVGILGYPNTGKSSLINSLILKASARVSPLAGYTKTIQKIRLARGIYLIDAPGILNPEEGTPINRETSVKFSQIGAIDWNKIRDPEMVVDSLMKEYPQVLQKHYALDAQNDSEVLIEELGRKLNYLKRGNQVDEIRTSKQVLRDWQEGKIRIKDYSNSQNL
jgi:ribosome biogenesis GTPase A